MGSFRGANISSTYRGSVVGGGARGRSSGSLAGGVGAMHLPRMKQLVQSLGTSPATWLIACACAQFIYDWGLTLPVAAPASALPGLAGTTPAHGA